MATALGKTEKKGMKNWSLKKQSRVSCWNVSWKYVKLQDISEFVLFLKKAFKYDYAFSIADT